MPVTKEELQSIRNKLLLLQNEVDELILRVGREDVLKDFVEPHPKDAYLYPHELPWSSKVHYALFQLDEATPKQVVDLILPIEKDMDEKSLLNIVSQNLLSMYTKDMVKRKKDGRRYKYSLNKDFKYGE